MALVSYSDSEGSDNEEQRPIAAPSRATTSTKPSPFATSKPAFAKSKVDRSEPRKIQVNLPATWATEQSEKTDDEPPVKKARTAGAFGGFNSLLPAPTKTTSHSLPKAGISLKTSSEAAFSRTQEPVISDADQLGQDQGASTNGESLSQDVAASVDDVKVVGKATKFKPLSVANSKKKVPSKKAVAKDSDVSCETLSPTLREKEKVLAGTQAVPASQPLKSKRSLFSVQQENNTLPAETTSHDYESITTRTESAADNEPMQNVNDEQTPSNSASDSASNSTSLQSLTSDLNLTPAQRRQLFGRHGKDANINIAHFNMDSEYAANEQLRQAGEVVEHRAVKAIAPGKHSLQQLVNNARSQQEAMEDKWAEGRRERGEGGSKYGWTR